MSFNMPEGVHTSDIPGGGMDDEEKGREWCAMKGVGFYAADETGVWFHKPVAWDSEKKTTGMMPWNEVDYDLTHSVSYI